MRAVAPHPLVQRRGELLVGDAAPVAAIEHLVLQVAKEPLARGVVRGAPLARHRARHAVELADARPAAPAVVAPAVAVAERPIALAELRARGLQGRVGQRGIRPGRDRPGHGLPVEQVDDRQEVGPAGVAGQPELGDVGDPPLVGRPGPEVVGAVRAQRQVRRPVADLAGVGAVPPAPPRVAHAQPALPHLGAHALLGDDDRLLPHAQAGPDGPAAAAPVLGLELLLDGVAEPVGPLRRGEVPELVVVGALECECHPLSFTGGNHAASGCAACASSNSSGLMYPSDECSLSLL